MMPTNDADRIRKFSVILFVPFSLRFKNVLSTDPVGISIMDHREAPECLDEAPHQGGPKRRKLNSLPQSLISEKQLTPKEVMGDEKNEQSLPEALPPLEVPTVAEEGPTPVRRSGRKRIMKKPDSSKDSDSKRKKVARPLFKTATKLPEKNKRTRASKCEEDSNNSKQDLTVKRSRKKRKPEGSCDSCSKTPPKVELIGDDERGHAIAEWYLLDIFEATRLITSNLHEGTQVTDCLVANMEETIIEIISKLLQRLSSVLITTLEQEFGIKCNILPVLRNLHENIKENVNQFAAKENDNSGIKFEPDEDSYQQALRCLDPKETVSVFEEDK
ncbi:hypothetical protein GE061_006079 [Apolygus lucorum]|uniref:Uncharacterized protein n=1 Tax=Apolygus lucorum TaxID=248454 RepID=A0A8S9WUJ0_APOLU|nr:hypothetical protein GE061_006079 [Apolygus lucorum]